MGMAREWGGGSLYFHHRSSILQEDGRKEVKVILNLHKLVLYYQTSERGIKGFRDLYCKTVYDFTREINR